MFLQILQFEMGNQVIRDIARLDILDQVPINGVLGRLFKSQTPFRFEPLAVPPTLLQLIT